MSINAMKLALEALENASPAAWASRVDSDTMKSIWRKHAEAMEGLQVLLAELDNASCKSVQKRLEAQQPATGELEPYDAGLLNDFGGGNVEWWQDYIRAELGNAHDFYQSQITTPQPAQVQGEAFGYIHHFAAHDERGVLIDTTWEADGCADPLPHPTSPSMWEWTHCTPFYTTPQPAWAAQAEVTDAQLTAAYLAWCKTNGTPESFARAILALRPERVPMTPAGRDVIMATRTANADADEWPEPWAYQRGWNDAEAHHDITTQAKKESM